MSNAPKYIVGQKVKLRTYQILDSKLATVLEVSDDELFKSYNYIVEYDIGGKGSWPQNSLGQEDEPDFPNIPFITNDSVVQQEPPLTETETIIQEQPIQTNNMQIEEEIQPKEQQITLLVEEDIAISNQENIEEVDLSTLVIPTLTKNQTIRLNTLNY